MSDETDETDETYMSKQDKRQVRQHLTTVSLWLSRRVDLHAFVNVGDFDA